MAIPPNSLPPGMSLMGEGEQPSQGKSTKLPPGMSLIQPPAQTPSIWQRLGNFGRDALNTYRGVEMAENAPLMRAGDWLASKTAVSPQTATRMAAVGGALFPGMGPLFQLAVRHPQGAASTVNAFNPAQGAGNVLGGWGRMGVGVGHGDLNQTAQGFNQLAKGATQVTAPLLVAAAPEVIAGKGLRTLGTEALGSTALGAGASKMAKVAGATPSEADALGNIVGGSAAGLLRAPTTEEYNQVAASKAMRQLLGASRGPALENVGPVKAVFKSAFAPRSLQAPNFVPNLTQALPELQRTGQIFEAERAAGGVPRIKVLPTIGNILGGQLQDLQAAKTAGVEAAEKAGHSIPAENLLKAGREIVNAQIRPADKRTAMQYVLTNLENQPNNIPLSRAVQLKDLLSTDKSNLFSQQNPSVQSAVANALSTEYNKGLDSALTAVGQKPFSQQSSNYGALAAVRKGLESGQTGEVQNIAAPETLRAFAHPTNDISRLFTIYSKPFERFQTRTHRAGNAMKLLSQLPEGFQLGSQGLAPPSQSSVLGRLLSGIGETGKKLRKPSGVEHASLVFNNLQNNNQ